MKALKILVILCFLVAMNLATTGFSHLMRTKAQYDSRLYELMLIHDGFTFLNSGGDAFGYQNYFKWQYAKALKDPKTPELTKFLFWPVGIFYSAINPPKEYAYPKKVKIENNKWGKYPYLGGIYTSYDSSQVPPDGHYTVARVSNWGGAIVILHKPGPDRDFAYLLVNEFTNTFPQRCKEGDKFTVFQGKMI